MTTGATLATDALFAIGAYGQGDTAPSDADMQLTLRTMNRLLDSYSNERQMVYDIYTDTFSTVAGTQSYSSTLLANGRPVNVDKMYATLSNVDYPVELISNQEWADIVYKPVISVPAQCYIDTGFPNTTFYFYPIPNAVYTVSVQCWKALQDAITTVSTLAMPLGYERLIVLQTAIEVAPSFNIQPSAALMQRATEAKINLKRNNYVPLVMDYGIKRKPDYITPLPPW